MNLKDILSDIQRSIDDLQGKLNFLRSVETGTLYDVDVLMKRKEAAYFLDKSLRQIDCLCGEDQLRRCYTGRGGVRSSKSNPLEVQGAGLGQISGLNRLRNLSNLYFSCHTHLFYRFLSLSRKEVSSSSTSSMLGRADFKFSGIALLSW